MFSTLLENFLPFSSNLKLLSANSFSVEESRICRLGKGYFISHRLVISILIIILYLEFVWLLFNLFFFALLSFSLYPHFSAIRVTTPLFFSSKGYKTPIFQQQGLQNPHFSAARVPKSPFFSSKDYKTPIFQQQGLQNP